MFTKIGTGVGLTIGALTLITNEALLKEESFSVIILAVLLVLCSYTMICSFIGLIIDFIISIIKK